MKQVERFDASPIEQELAFKKWCEARGIEIILFDGDDTLWKTRPIFLRQQELCYNFLADKGKLNRQQWKEVIEEKNDEMFERVGVNPIRWDFVIDSLSHYGLTEEDKDQAKQILRQIYYTKQEFMEGAASGLKFLGRVGIPKVIVTHANIEWTIRKYGWLDLGKYFDWDDINIVDEDGHKTAESWLEAIKYFGVRPENCMVIGDSPRSDINPAISIGVRTCGLLQNGTGIWSVHQQSIDDENVVWSISGINDLRWFGREIVHRKN